MIYYIRVKKLGGPGPPRPPQCLRPCFVVFFYKNMLSYSTYISQHFSLNYDIKKRSGAEKQLFTQFFATSLAYDKNSSMVYGGCVYNLHNSVYFKPLAHYDNNDSKR